MALRRLEHRCIPGGWFANLWGRIVPNAARSARRLDCRRKPGNHLRSVSDYRCFGWLSVALVVGYFLVGWWPFAFRPLNQVRWLPDRAGLDFADDGIAHDFEALPDSGKPRVAGQPANYTVELWVEAGVKPATDVFHLLTLHDGQLPSPFVLCQWRQAIILRAATRDPRSARRIHEVGVDGALEERRVRLITVTGSGAGTDFYLDGMRVGHFPEFVLDPEVLAGRMILGNSPAGKHSWVGRFFGLALYSRALEATEIAQHHAAWTRGLAPQFVNDPGLRALYVFDEGRGQRAEDRSRNRHWLTIPAIYRPFDNEFLVPPWRDMAYEGPDYRDIAVNIMGFVPFGVCLFLHRRRTASAPRFADALFVVVAGGVISLTIETIQVWLPTRASSLTDLLANTVGTLLGVLLALALRLKFTSAECGSPSPS